MSNCIEGHRAFLYDRGGVQRIDELTNLAVCEWGRVRDDISEAHIDISAMYCDRQASVLNMIEPGRHELVVYRGDQRQWEGPITRLAISPSGVSVFAKDVLHYTYMTAMQSAYSNAWPDVDYVTNRIAHIITEELTRKDLLETAAGLPSVNVLPFLVNHHQPTDARTAASTVAMQYTVFEHLDNLAADNGIDYTVVGRAIHLFDTHESLGQTAVATEDDFLGEILVSSYGLELGTRAISTDGQGVYGAAGGVDPFYGLWERLTTAYDEETDDGPPPSQTELASQAQRNLAGRNPTPTVVRIPDNSTLNPNGNLTLDELVPGVLVPLRAKVLVRNLKQMQKVDKVTVREDENGETISVTLFPAPQEPVDIEE